MIILLIFYAFYAKLNLKNYNLYKNNLTAVNQNAKLRMLTKTSGVTNLPNVHVITGESYPDSRVECDQRPFFISPHTEEVKEENLEIFCKNTCGGGGNVFTINENEEVYWDEVKLTPGHYCTTKLFDCNLRLNRLIAGPYSQQCVSKFPRMVQNSRPVACSDLINRETGGVLMDYLTNTPLDPMKTIIVNENETLPDGRFRFGCEYITDEHIGVKWLDHPANRFQPIEDGCRKLVKMAHPSVGSVFEDGAWQGCDCGDESVTRVSNQDPDDKRTPCTSCVFSKSDKKINFPSRCFTYNSKSLDSKKYPPCVDYLSSVFCNQSSIDIQEEKVNEKDPNQSKISGYSKNVFKKDRIDTALFYTTSRGLNSTYPMGTYLQYTQTLPE